MWNFKPAFSLPFFTLIKRLFSSSTLSAIRVVSFAYLKLLIFLLIQGELIQACVSSSLAFHMMHSAYKLNKQGDYLTLRYSFPNFETSQLFHVQSNYGFLTYIQVSQETGKVLWYFHL